ncbi:hypothetical protein [Aestuariivirga sp.]|uniref:hypothetical protein n=1 Tax=Aestuariivirga sp. TaxID=2650926 RepID=UPI0039E4AACA
MSHLDAVLRVRIPRSLSHRLKSAARSESRGMSAIVRQCVLAELQRLDAPCPASRDPDSEEE